MGTHEEWLRDIERREKREEEKEREAEMEAYWYQRRKEVELDETTIHWDGEDDS